MYGCMSCGKEGQYPIQGFDIVMFPKGCDSRWAWLPDGSMGQLDKLAMEGI